MFLIGHAGDDAIKLVPGIVTITATWHELRPNCGCSTSHLSELRAEGPKQKTTRYAGGSQRLIEKDHSQ
jgi:hypothetical protein